ncbi:MAG: glycosyltransferase [Thermoleophilia bacterium]|nr:glycosyltransferase [Thermoleophilia bacterium]
MGLRIASTPTARAEAPRVSLCMIVKDEEAHLERCLASARAAVDEMIVVDTGSTDGSVAIAERMGARVLHHEWTGDFAAARNVSLEAATGDWILYLDADEELADGAQVRALVGDPDAEGFFLREVSYLGDEVGIDAVANPAFRLFRNRPGYRFRGALHEQILPSLPVEARNRAKFTGAEILHYGYLRPSVLERGKIARNLEILEQELKAKPKDAFTLFNAGMETQRAGDLERAVDYYRRAYAALEDPNLNFASMLIRNMLVALNDLGRHRDVVEVTAEAKLLYPDLVDLHYLEAEAHAGLRDYAAAIESARAAVGMGERSGPQYLSQVGMGSFHTLNALGGYHLAIGDTAAGVVALRDAVTSAKGLFPPAIARLTRVLLASDPPDAVADYMVRILPERKRGDAILVVASVMAHDGHPAPALELVAAAEADGADPAMAAITAATCLIALEDPAAAAGRLRAVPAGSRLRRLADRIAFTACLLAGDRPGASAALAALSEAGADVDAAACEIALECLDGEPGAAPAEVDRAALVDELLALADATLEAGRLEVANRLITTLYRIAPDPDRVHERLGQVLMRRDFPDPAADRLMAAVQAGVATPDAYGALARISAHRDMPDEAGVFLELALDADQANLNRYLELARHEARLGRYREAADVMTRGLTIYPQASMLRDLRQSFLLLAQAA